MIVFVFDGFDGFSQLSSGNTSTSTTAATFLLGGVSGWDSSKIPASIITQSVGTATRRSTAQNMPRYVAAGFSSQLCRSHVAGIRNPITPVVFNFMANCKVCSQLIARFARS